MQDPNTLAAMVQSTDFWISLSFIIFLFVLWKFGKNAVLNMIDTKIDTIKKDIETAENLRIEAQELLAQYQRKHKDSIKEAQGIIKSAEDRVTEIRRNADQEINDMIAIREKQLQERLNRMEESAIEDIRRYAADLTVTATARIIQDQLDAKTDEKLIKETSKKISASFH